MATTERQLVVKGDPMIAYADPAADLSILVIGRGVSSDRRETLHTRPLPWANTPTYVRETPRCKPRNERRPGR